MAGYNFNRIYRSMNSSLYVLSANHLFGNWTDSRSLIVLPFCQKQVFMILFASLVGKAFPKWDLGRSAPYFVLWIS